MRLRLWTIGAASLIALLAFPAAAQASVGVGIQPGPVRLSGAAHAGSSYSLPAVLVANTGTFTESVDVKVERISPGTGRTVPPSWVQASSSVVSLTPGQSARVPLQLEVPASAKPGRYFSDVVVTAVNPNSAGTAGFGAGAATDLEFTVAAGAPPGGWFTIPGWVLVAIVVILALAVAAFFVRRSGLRIRIEREPAGRALAGGRLTPRRVLSLLAVPVAAIGVASCGTQSAPPQGSSNGASITLYLTTVSYIRSVQVSPSSAKLTSCTGGDTSDDTPSTARSLGFPNGRCYFPATDLVNSSGITITNNGIAASVDSSVSDASPVNGSGDGDNWNPCNRGSHPVVTCTGSHHLPGSDQYQLVNFNQYHQMNLAGLSGNVACDRVFTADGSCFAHHGSAINEGVEFIGPSTTTDFATRWQLTITWYAVP
jgi:hypothetical protein